MAAVGPLALSFYTPVSRCIACFVSSYIFTCACDIDSAFKCDSNFAKISDSQKKNIAHLCLSVALLTAFDWKAKCMASNIF